MLPPSYQAITQRPVLKLPNHARVAVWVVMNVEHFTFYCWSTTAVKIFKTMLTSY
ncbi:hypothetical protein [Nodularia spumigena]|uniref:Uncharacterized protein n=1 Tax=Nodularia spumigena UHCC 0039 TaxID=1914872 RepID=A0A2S0Q8M5_NODSP|nr:hypothetical protein [Nodularia spumigena]AVZ30734.1 hypothetical protein BMF81_02655 [Nodularia spumigena UHCC 0039]MDB9322678.1 hypothetical protein [Nodularia spumigena CS-591/07A]MDB9329627.1 hypothetical protein [Nodularia spumigena CS-591/04]MDB9360501.1 hypothetical protein [Nodularia spumigena CS-588/02]MDB9363933.1 hypothetical protein [Nodularia spumigena CS-588/02A10]MDB9398940.1 hypothetical protein [Microcystis aeruginosa CS-567/02-A1]